MRRLAVCMLLVFAVPAVFAVDLGRAEGSLNVGGTAVPLAYAYVMDGAHNDLTGRNDATKIILTDKPLPAGTRDPHTPEAGRDTVRAGLDAAGTLYRWSEYDAEHAFGRDVGERYDPEATDAAFAETVALFRTRM